ncbi:MAG: hypothetical protein QF704_00055 [Anaerolineales bacterium]|jgi:hypothetical protein|nr:hypothetical protein [Anaerolineales bacterium]
MGRKKLEIDYLEVERLAGIGLSNAEIADAMGFAEATLYRKKKDNESFESALKKGKAKASADIANVVYEMAMAKNLPAAIWYEKTRRGLSDKQSVEIEGKVEFVLDVSADPKKYKRKNER